MGGSYPCFGFGAVGPRGAVVRASFQNGVQQLEPANYLLAEIYLVFKKVAIFVQLNNVPTDLTAEPHDDGKENESLATEPQESVTRKRRAVGSGPPKRNKAAKGIEEPVSKYLNAIVQCENASGRTISGFVDEIIPAEETTNGRVWYRLLWLLGDGETDMGDVHVEDLEDLLLDPLSYMPEGEVAEDPAAAAAEAAAVEAAAEAAAVEASLGRSGGSSGGSRSSSE